MAQDDLIMALGKVIIAAAWADGEIANEEVNSLKDLLFHLPGLTARDWAELQIYMETPVGDAERARLIEELQAAIRTGKDKQLAMEAIDRLIGADGAVTDEEHAAAEDIKQAIDEASVGVVGALSRLMNSSISRRSQAVENAPNREDHLEDFLANRVYYGMQLSDHAIDLPEATLRKLALAGGLMGQVAHVDKAIEEAEVAAIVEALTGEWHISREDAQVVAEIATSPLAADMDLYRLTREFFEVCQREELIGFVGVLFKVAAADGMATKQEIDEIRLISRQLLLSNAEFIQAKLTLPREKRAE